MPERSSARAALRKRVSKVPSEPGVYRWLDAHGKVLYIGKAKNLKNRMQTYVQDGLKRSAWTEIMVRQIADFDVTVVRSEIEALILENNLIKELKPRYNILLKDDKGYVYVRVSLRNPYPSVEIVRRLQKDGARYFGPFLGVRDTEHTLKLLDDILPYRACRRSLDALNKAHGGATEHAAPCLDFQIGRCCGLCMGALTQVEYRRRIDELVSFFRGNLATVKRIAKEKMERAASDRKFEQAVTLRDALRFIEGLEQRQAVSDPMGDDLDVFGIALQSGKAQVVLLRQRGGKLIEHVGFALSGDAETAAVALEQFLPQYYEQTEDLPDTIILRDAPDAKQSLEAWLREKRGRGVSIVVPERGKKSKLLEMAERNAEEKVRQQFAAWEAEAQKGEEALRGLQELLHLSAPPKRIEGYDISHLGGTATVGSMVVMLNGKPKREHYRSFNITSVTSGNIDDYKSLAEVLRRRLKYLVQSGKKQEAFWNERGLSFGKARKEEQKIIDEIVQNNDKYLGSHDLDYRRFLLARRDKKIIAMAQLYSYDKNVPTIRTVWVDDAERGHRLGQFLIRKMLKSVAKAKVYATIPKELEEYYGELGFRSVLKGPQVLEDLLDRFLKEDTIPERGLIVMYEAKKHVIDESFTSTPDLLLIDGGKGQLSAIVKVLQELDLNIPVAGLAKREEEIFLPDQPVSLLVKEGSEARFLLQRLRDEAHRFANLKREKRLTASLFESALDSVEGIGDITKMALLKKFGSFDAVIAAADQELLGILNTTQFEALRKKFPMQ